MSGKAVLLLLSVQRFIPAGSWQPPPDPTLNKAALARLQAEESSRRLVRIANETLRHAFTLDERILQQCFMAQKPLHSV